MALTISNSGGTLLTAATPIDLTEAGTYYFKRIKTGGVKRKITIDTSPSARGSFVQDFDDASWPLTGGSIIINASSEAECKSAFESYSNVVSQQIGLTVESTELPSNYAHCVNTSFEIVRRGDGRMVIPNGDGTLFRMYVDMEFVQLSK